MYKLGVITVDRFLCRSCKQVPVTNMCLVQKTMNVHESEMRIQDS